MRLSFVFAAIAASSFIAATPIRRDGVSSTADGMVNIINGDAQCAKVGVIFARGTFDEGWVQFTPNEP
jgi:hypothetical protein